MLDSEAQQKVMVRIRRAVLNELSSKQYAPMARAMKVPDCFVSLVDCNRFFFIRIRCQPAGFCFTAGVTPTARCSRGRRPVILPKDSLKVRSANCFLMSSVVVACVTSQ